MAYGLPNWEMTIVKKVAALAHHEPRGIADDCIPVLLHDGQPYPFGRSDLVLLSAFLQVTGHALDRDTLRSDRVYQLTAAYLGALHSRRFVAFHPIALRTRSLRFVRAIERITGAEIEIELTTGSVPEVLRGWVSWFEHARLIEDEVWLWSGYPLADATGRVQYLGLQPLYEALGREFAQRFGECCKRVKSSRRGSTLSIANNFCNFIREASDGTQITAPRTPIESSELITAFGKYFFTFQDHVGSNLSSAAKSWNVQGPLLFNAMAQEGLIPKWDLPFPTIRLGSGRATRGSTGLVESLLVNLDPGLGDDDLRKKMFEEITEATNVVRQWASSVCDDLWQRKMMAVEGAIRGDIRIPGNTSNPGNALDADSTSWGDDVCATYEHWGHASHRFGEGCAPVPAGHMFGCSSKEVAHKLGLPTPFELLAFATLLVLANPAITTSFLESLEIIESEGEQSIIQGDEGSKFIVGYKMRRGACDAEMRIKIDSSSVVLLEQIITLTAPLRSYLKFKGDSSYRKAFLGTTSATSYPRVPGFSAEAARADHVERNARSIRRETGVTREVAHNLAANLSLRSVRATAAVLTYLKTGSVERMSSSLGHKSYNPQLIERYLPVYIRAAIEEYWIKTFQVSLVGIALRDSVALEPAVGHQGLDITKLVQNTRLMRFITPAERTRPAHKPGRVLVEVSTASLTEMATFMSKVERSSINTPEDIYIAKLVKAISDKIENNPSRPDLIARLGIARARARAKETTRE